jgi:hypothetical protein
MADEAAADFLESRGIYATPILQVGDELLIGFQPDRVDRLLGLSPPG